MSESLFDLDALEPTAVLSSDGTYRYRLTRTWEPSKARALFIMLNPSTADASVDDPTIRRCIGFAKRLDCGGIVVVNLYAHRATQPDDMWAAAAEGADIVGPENNQHIWEALMDAETSDAPVIAAWGADRRIGADRLTTVFELDGMESCQALGLTKDGAPRHPLYVRGDAPLVAYRPRSRVDSEELPCPRCERQTWDPVDGCGKCGQTGVVHGSEEASDE